MPFVGAGIAIAKTANVVLGTQRARVDSTGNGIELDGPSLLGLERQRSDSGTIDHAHLAGAEDLQSG